MHLASAILFLIISDSYFCPALRRIYQQPVKFLKAVRICLRTTQRWSFCLINPDSDASVCIGHKGELLSIDLVFSFFQETGFFGGMFKKKVASSQSQVNTVDKMWHFVPTLDQRKHYWRVSVTKKCQNSDLREMPRPAKPVTSQETSRVSLLI